MPLKDFISILFKAYQNKNNKYDYIEPTLPKADLELKMLDHIYSLPFAISLHRDEFILDISRFKKSLKEIGITGEKSALKYLNKIKTKGHRLVIQENLINIYLQKTTLPENNKLILDRFFKEIFEIIDKAGFGQIEMDDYTHAGTVYDMLIIFYVSNLCFIVGYIDVMEYNCFCRYATNSCRGIFNSKSEYYKSYLIGKGVSNINGKDIRTSALMLSEFMNK